jgi:2-C-methyl-D-erythritol 2,4-cyclodiphosphate synthase
MLGGVEIQSDLGEVGHSDGDVLYHAIVDAMLGSIAAGDIGRHFPPSDQRWKDAPSRIFAERALELLEASGWHLVNVDTTVILERPRLAPLIDTIRGALAAVLGLPLESVSLKAKTHEGVDAAGRLEAVEAQAIVLVERAGD